MGLTRDSQIIQSHVGETRKRATMFMPPCNCIVGTLHISTEVAIYLVTEVSRFGWCKSRYMIKDILALGIRQH
jgi:hypothetical protein